MTLSLVVRRTIRASRERLFEAWTRPEQLLRWWGPKGVRCSHAEVDARVGGALRIGNALPDGSTVWILGEFLEVVPGERLVYTWRTEPGRGGARERVTVRFESRGEAVTEVIVVHERIAEVATRQSHADGWDGCLDGLDAWIGSPAAAVVVEPYVGSREALRELFELAEDSAARLDEYLTHGEVLVARVGGHVVGHLQVVAASDGALEIKNMAVAAAQQGRGIGRSLVEAALDEARRRRCPLVLVATASADVGNLRFYQRLGFRMARVERDAFGPATGYPTAMVIDGVELRDRVWLDREP